MGWGGWWEWAAAGRLSDDRTERKTTSSALPGRPHLTSHSFQAKADVRGRGGGAPQLLQPARVPSIRGKCLLSPRGAPSWTTGEGRRQPASPRLGFFDPELFPKHPFSFPRKALNPRPRSRRGTGRPKASPGSPAALTPGSRSSHPARASSQRASGWRPQWLPIVLVFRVQLPSVSRVSAALSGRTFIPQTLSVEHRHGLPRATCPSSIPQGSRGHAASCAQTQELPGGAAAKGRFPFATEKDGSLKTGADPLRCFSENVTCLLRRKNRSLGKAMQVTDSLFDQVRTFLTEDQLLLSPA